MINMAGQHSNTTKGVVAAIGILFLGFGMAACSDANEAESADAKASLVDQDNKEIGTASFTDEDGAVRVEVNVDKGLKEGFHGMHIHENGSCEAGGDEPFESAGGHLQVDGHKGHPTSGDLVSLHIGPDGDGYTTTSTTAVNIDQIDGKSLIIHTGPDNFGNIPDRYSVKGKPGPDEKTLKTGDAGGRAACGVISKGNSDN